MTDTARLNGTWLRASVLGCLWAASEIVLGSFLHNLRVPFTGNIMTGIAIILLVSVGYIWDQKGLFWRAGLICALMKSISPSAVIFGPMIAICCEALLLEISVRIAGRNIFGFLLGGMLAMLWNLLHFILSYIVFYGSGIVGLYKKIAVLAGKQLGMDFENGAEPLLALALLYMFLGLIASAMGIYIGVKVKKTPPTMANMPVKNVMQRQKKDTTSAFRYSLFWLFASMLAIITELCLIGYTVAWIWVPAGLFLVVCWSVRYRNSLRPLKKPRFWLGFFLITFLMSWLYSGIQTGEIIAVEGLVAGLQMNFRAVVMIIGFSAIGAELVNPAIKKIFSGSRFRQLAVSLEVAMGTLPLVVANLPAPKTILRRPLGTMKQLVMQAGTWLDKVSFQFSEKPFVIVISGKLGSGKSALLFDLARKLKEAGVHIEGFIAPSVKENDIRAGYDLYDIGSATTKELARTRGDDTMPYVGKYFFRPAGIEAGHAILRNALQSRPRWLAVDEIGPWELAGQGWASGLNSLLTVPSVKMIWVVRQSLVQEVIANWNIQQYVIFDPAQNTAADVFDLIMELQKKTNAQE